jgi:acyl-CoA-binding protein
MASAHASNGDRNHEENDDDDIGIFGDDEESCVGGELEKLFNEATVCVRRRAGQLSKEALLYLYARFKFANDGACTSARPGGLFNYEAKSKWDAWNALSTRGGDMSKEKAMQEYVNKVDELVPAWRSRESTERSGANKFNKADEKGTFGVRMSTMGGVEPAEQLNDADKTLFDLCKEGALAPLAARLDKLTIDQTDENGMTLLMWACDRGHVHIVKYLLEAQAQVNVRDNDGQTCLHYASSCEHVDIVRLLVIDGGGGGSQLVDKSIADNEGLRAIDLTENAKIIDLLK